MLLVGVTTPSTSPPLTHDIVILLAVGSCAMIYAAWTIGLIIRRTRYRQFIMRTMTAMSDARIQAVLRKTSAILDIGRYEAGHAIRIRLSEGTWTRLIPYQQPTQVQLCQDSTEVSELRFDTNHLTANGSRQIVFLDGKRPTTMNLPN